MRIFLSLILLASCASPKMSLKTKTDTGGIIEYKDYGKEPHKKWSEDIKSYAQCKYGYNITKHGRKTEAGVVTYEFNSAAKIDEFVTEDDLKRLSLDEQKKSFKFNMQATKDAVNLPEDGKTDWLVYEFKCLGLERKPCLAGEPGACFEYGKELELAGKLRDAYRFHKYGCKIGSPKSCFHAASILYNAQKNSMTKKALEFYKKSCTEEYSRGCFVLAQHFAGKNRIMQSSSYYKRHCNYDMPEDAPIDHDQVKSCFQAGEISFLRNKKPAAIEYYERGCDLRGKSPESETMAMKSCARLGVLNRNKDLRDLGIEYLSVNCSGKSDKEACYEVAVTYSLARDISMSLNYMERLFKLKFKDWDRLNQDRMLDNVKRSPAFKRMLRKYLKPIDDPL